MADPNVLHLAHYTIVVRDIHLAEAFYAKVMDVDVMRRSWNPDEPDPPEGKKHRRFSQLKLGSVVFDAFEEPCGPWPERRNLTQHPHYAFEVKSLKESSIRLDEHNIPYEWNTFNGPGVGIYFSDPDGNHLEYIESRGHSKEGIKFGDPDWRRLQYDFDPQTGKGRLVNLAESTGAEAH